MSARQNRHMNRSISLIADTPGVKSIHVMLFRLDSELEDSHWIWNDPVFSVGFWSINTRENSKELEYKQVD